MSELRGRIKDITEQLHSLTKELSAVDEASARELVEEVLGSDLMVEFKTSVDALRHLVWIYIEAHSRKNIRATPLTADPEKLERATTLLRTLHGAEDLVSEDSTLSFLEGVQRVVDRHAPPRSK